jgi:hypothetical protein
MARGVQGREKKKKVGQEEKKVGGGKKKHAHSELRTKKNTTRVTNKHNSDGNCIDYGTNRALNGNDVVRNQQCNKMNAWDEEIADILVPSSFRAAMGSPHHHHDHHHDHNPSSSRRVGVQSPHPWQEQPRRQQIHRRQVRIAAAMCRFDSRGGEVGLSCR